jgi:hypothetical protein
MSSFRTGIAIVALMIAGPAMAVNCGEPDHSYEGELSHTCPGMPKPMPGSWRNWDGCNGREYDACGRLVWVHYRHWRKPPWSPDKWCYPRKDNSCLSK